jgi:sterol 3beta-glucosyltransferase
VQPYLALALGLKEAGHEGLIAAPSQFEAFVGTRGVAFAHLPGEFLELMETPRPRPRWREAPDSRLASK